MPSGLVRSLEYGLDGTYAQMPRVAINVRSSVWSPNALVVYVNALLMHWYYVFNALALQM